MANQDFNISANEQSSTYNPDADPWSYQKFITTGYSQNQETQPATEGPSLIYSSRQLEVELPNFNGQNPEEWLVKAEQYFACYNVPNTQRIMQCSWYFEFNIRIWYYGRIPEFDSWENFKHSLIDSFSDQGSELEVCRSTYAQYLREHEYIQTVCTNAKEKVRHEEENNHEEILVIEDDNKGDLNGENSTPVLEIYQDLLASLGLASNEIVLQESQQSQKTTHNTQDDLVPQYIS